MCPLIPEAARVSFLDAFWSGFELLWGGLGGTFRHFSVLVSWCVFGAALEQDFERFWFRVGSLFGPLLVPFGWPG